MQADWAASGAWLGGELAKGRLRPVTAAAYPLEEAAKAHEDIMSGQAAKGKLVLQIKAN